MQIFRLLGIYTVIPATVFLTISYFVMLTLRKVENRGSRAFGNLVVFLLWVCALVIFLSGVYAMVTGRHPIVMIIHQAIKTPM
ncbi:MAG: hypothetical protein PHD29_07050 [bacterium]|nr:hypothetical protein [bacterium]MDD5353832.1 hypothetical protein [bacterium]